MPPNVRIPHVTYKFCSFISFPPPLQHHRCSSHELRSSHKRSHKPSHKTRHNISCQIPRPRSASAWALSLLAHCMSLFATSVYSSHACLLPSAPSPPTQPRSKQDGLDFFLQRTPICACTVAFPVGPSDDLKIHGGERTLLLSYVGALVCEVYALVLTPGPHSRERRTGGVC